MLPLLELRNGEFSPALLVEQDSVDPVHGLIGIKLLSLLPHTRRVGRR